MKFVTTPLLGAILFCAVVPVEAQSQAADATPAFRKLDSVEARVQGCVTCHDNRARGPRMGTFHESQENPPGISTISSSPFGMALGIIRR